MDLKDDDEARPDRRRALRRLTALAVAGIAPAWLPAAARRRYELDWTPAKEIVVEKSRRRLHLVRADGMVRSWSVCLGAAPRGHKQCEGDNRTPEGRYLIDYKNINSRFFLSVRVSYPNEADRARARRLGLDPGGNIMIHGMPNGVRPPYRGYLGHDWTNGCIAVTNDAMTEIWLAARETTPVVILA
jgi:murein L,D-transpeptidase YafK